MVVKHYTRADLPGAMFISWPGTTLAQPEKEQTMGHGFEDNDEMAYVGEIPWHGRGIKLNGVASLIDLKEQLPQVFYEVYKEQAAMPSDGKLIQTWATRRRDTGDILGVVGSGYEVVQNEEAVRFFDQVCMDPNGPKYETCGTIHGGKLFWALAKLPTDLLIADVDLLENYLMLVNSFDMSQPLKMYFTSIRAVCQNTIELGWAKRVGKSFKMKHTAGCKGKAEEAREALSIASAHVIAMEGMIEEMRRWEPTTKQIDDVIEKLLTRNNEEDAWSARSENTKKAIKYLMAYGRGQDLPGVRGTGWALYNAVAEHVDYESTIRVTDGKVKEDARMESVMFGAGSRMKRAASDLILAAANS